MPKAFERDLLQREAYPGQEIGIVPLPSQAKPYKGKLEKGEELRIFNPRSVGDLVPLILGERGKILRQTIEAKKQEIDVSPEEWQKLDKKVIQTFFETREPISFSVHFLTLLNYDGSSGQEHARVYPVVVSTSKHTPDILK